jgi:hypothetical protein
VSRGGSIANRTAAASIVAAATNAVVFGLGRLVGVLFEVSNDPDPVRLVWVILETIAAVAIGVAISLAVRRRWAHLGPLVRMGFALLGLASLLAPLLLGQGWPTKLLLALMHLVGVSTFVAATRVAPASAALRGQDPPQC